MKIAYGRNRKRLTQIKNKVGNLLGCSLGFVIIFTPDSIMCYYIFQWPIATQRQAFVGWDSFTECTNSVTASHSKPRASHESATLLPHLLHPRVLRCQQANRPLSLPHAPSLPPCTMTQYAAARYIAPKHKVPYMYRKRGRIKWVGRGASPCGPADRAFPNALAPSFSQLAIA